MNQCFNPAQSGEIDDRIVEMIVAVFGEGPEARRCRAIANERWLDSQSEADDLITTTATVNLPPISSAPRDRFILSYCPDAPCCSTWPTAPWIVVRWHDDTDAWRDQDGIQVCASGWLPLTDENLRLLSPEGIGPQALVADEHRGAANGGVIERGSSLPGLSVTFPVHRVPGAVS